MPEGLSLTLLVGLFGGIGGAVVTVAVHGLRSRLNRPRLEVRGPIFQEGQVGLRIWYVIIGNSGKTSAKRCAAQLSVIPREPVLVNRQGLVTQGDQAEMTRNLFGMIVPWDRADSPPEIDIHREQQQRVKICEVLPRSPSFSDRPEVRIPGERLDDPSRACFSTSVMEFALQVGSENSPPLPIFGRVTTTTSGSDLEITNKLKMIVFVPRAAWWQRLFPKLFPLPMVRPRRNRRR